MCRLYIPTYNFIFNDVKIKVDPKLKGDFKNLLNTPAEAFENYLIQIDWLKKLSNSSFVLRSLGDDMALFLASGHSVPGTASFKVKKFVGR